ncbi:MAG TPA: hypothetical protein VNJ31_10295 [Methyloceanibacter sp.]|nr:hypothetical protein [Methyloceanibacter sp.]
MSYIFAIMAVPLLSATGIYDPPVMRNGHCIAQPGSFDALYCPAPEAKPKRQARRRN